MGAVRDALAGFDPADTLVEVPDEGAASICGSQASILVVRATFP